MKIVFIFCIRVIDINNKLWQISVPLEMLLFSFAAYTTFFIVGLILSMQIPFVGFQPIKTSEHMASAGMYIHICRINLVKNFTMLMKTLLKKNCDTKSFKISALT